MSGLEVAARLRIAGSQAAIVFLTVHSDPEVVDAALAAGGNGYVIKSRLASDLCSPCARHARDERSSRSSVEFERPIRPAEHGHADGPPNPGSSVQRGERIGRCLRGEVDSGGGTLVAATPIDHGRPAARSPAGGGPSGMPLRLGNGVVLALREVVREFNVPHGPEAERPRRQRSQPARRLLGRRHLLRDEEFTIVSLLWFRRTYGIVGSVLLSALAIEIIVAQQPPNASAGLLGTRRTSSATRRRLGGAVHPGDRSEPRCSFVLRRRSQALHEDDLRRRHACPADDSADRRVGSEVRRRPGAHRAR